MLEEVSCPQLQITHITSDEKLLYERLIKGTKEVSRDVKPLFNKSYIQDMGVTLFALTPYARHKYKVDNQDNTTDKHIEELTLDEL